MNFVLFFSLGFICTSLLLISVFLHRLVREIRFIQDYLYTGFNQLTDELKNLYNK